MADMRTNRRASRKGAGVTGPAGLSAVRSEPAPTALERFGFGGEDEPPSRGLRLL